ncbi:hypothetical protein BJV77DRAFT_1037215 [Russula vinacea]|nr:hypothetical protein BJV77DRAFT_1037215 [Russula vinacea]
MISWMLEVDDVACPVGAMKKSTGSGYELMRELLVEGPRCSADGKAVLSAHVSPVHAHALVTTRR